MAESESKREEASLSTKILVSIAVFCFVFFAAPIFVDKYYDGFLSWVSDMRRGDNGSMSPEAIKNFDAIEAQFREKERQRWADPAQTQVPDYASLDLTVGFRGIPWGTNLHAVEGFELVSSNSSLHTEDFIRKGEWPQLGGLKLKNVSYKQCDGYFYSAHLNIESSGAAALSTTKLLWGEPRSYNEKYDYYSWTLGTYERYLDSSGFDTLEATDRGPYLSPLVDITLSVDDFPPVLLIDYVPTSRYQLGYWSSYRNQVEDQNRQEAAQDFYGRP